MPKTFILNDENKKNQYGFRVKNSGMMLDRFKANPVLLDSHRSYGTDGVIGRWENIRIENGLLLADAVFNEDDPEAMKVAQKVESGFLRGASLGLDPYTMENFEINEFDGVPDLLKSEVMEASIVAIPNNANAIKLYAATQQGRELLNDSSVNQLLLMVNDISNYKSNMKTIKLTAFAAMAIALSADAEHDGEAVSAGILKLKADLDKAYEKIQGFEQLEADKKTKLTADTVDADIKAGKIDATKRAEFIKLHAEMPEVYKAVVTDKPGKETLSGKVNNPAFPSEIKSIEDFQKLNLDAQLEFKTNQPDAYKALFNV